MRHLSPNQVRMGDTLETAAPRRRSRGLLAVALILALGWAAASHAAVSQNVDTLDWLSGCWRMESGETVVEEHWMNPSGDSMIGMSRTIRNGTLVGYELILIIETDTGLIYRPHPSGQVMANFSATEASSRRAVFENEFHDFPRRIAYWRTGDDNLSARVDDGADGQSYELAYRRFECPAD